MERMVEELDEVDEPHPAIELGLWWLRENRPPARPPVVSHGDFRIGNVVVDEHGLAGLLDWEFAHLDDPARDLSFGLVRAWRFGVDDKRLGGIGDVEPYLERYNELTGFDVRPEELDYWELAGNVAWAIGCLTQAQRHLSGPGPERRARHPRPARHRGRVRDLPPAGEGGGMRRCLRQRPG